MKKCGLQLLTELTFGRCSSSGGRVAIVVAVAAAAGFFWEAQVLWALLC